MGNNSLFLYLKKLRKLHVKNSQKHQRMIQILDNLEMLPLPVMHNQDHLQKIAVDSKSLMEFAEIANDLYETDTLYPEILDNFEEKISEISKIKRITKNLKHHLEHIKERIHRDNKSVQNVSKRISAIIKEFRERTRENFIDYLKSVDLDLRRILKPLVPNKVIDENVNFPMINANLSLVESLESSKFSKNSEMNWEDTEREEEDKDKTIEKLHEHVSMLVNSLESIAKELINILSETNSKYYEMVNPSGLTLNLKTPLAKPLPEWFTFNVEESYDDTPKILENQKQAYNKIKKRLNELKENAELSPAQVKLFQDKLDKMKNEKKNDINEIFKDTDVPISKREEIIFKLINTNRTPVKDVNIQDMIGVLSVKCLHRKETVQSFSKIQMPEKIHKRKHLEIDIDARRALTPVPMDTGFSTPQLDKLLQKRPSNPDILKTEKEKSPRIEKQKTPNKEIRVRSITPTLIKKKAVFKTGISLKRKKTNV